MAKRQVFGGGMVVHFTNEPEDYLICDAIDKVDPFVPPQNTQWSEFKYFYLEEGKGVRDRNLMDLNAHLKRKGLPIIVLKSTHSDSHSAYSGMDKAKARDAIMAHLKSLSPDHRTILLTRQRHLIEMQPDYDGVEAPILATPAPPRPTVAPLPLKGIRPEPIQVTKPQVEPVARVVPEPVLAAADPAKPPHVNTGSIWMHRYGQRKRVKPAEVEQRLRDGWAQGYVIADPISERDPDRSASTAFQPGTVWVNRDGERQRVPLAALTQRINEGWARGLGRIKTSRQPKPTSEPEVAAAPEPLPPDTSADIRRLWSEISILHAKVEELTDEVEFLRGPRRRRSVIPPRPTSNGRGAWG